MNSRDLSKLTRFAGEFAQLRAIQNNSNRREFEVGFEELCRQSAKVRSDVEQRRRLEAPQFTSLEFLLLERKEFVHSV